MKEKNLFHREADKGETFSLLSEFYYLPEEETISKLRTLESLMTRACTDAVPYVAEMRERFEDEEDIESLKVDFSKLFVGPFKVLAPPYGSVYMEGGRTIMGDSTLDALNRYREEGLDVSNDFHDAPDHIAAELEFAYFLILKVLKAARHSDMDLTGRYLQKRKRFLTDHLGAWISDFQRYVEKNAETNFYKNLARATKALIEKDLEDLSKYIMAPN